MLATYLDKLRPLGLLNVIAPLIEGKTVSCTDICGLIKEHLKSITEKHLGVLSFYGINDNFGMPIGELSGDLEVLRERGKLIGVYPGMYKLGSKYTMDEATKDCFKICDEGLPTHFAINAFLSAKDFKEHEKGTEIISAFCNYISEHREMAKDYKKSLKQNG